MGDRTGLKPVMRLMTIVLSNGATLRMPTAAVRTKPFVATQDLHSHNVWAVPSKGGAAAAASRVRRVDFSDFYRRFGLGGGGDDDGGGAPGEGGSDAGGGGGSAPAARSSGGSGGSSGSSGSSSGGKGGGKRR